MDLRKDTMRQKTVDKGGCVRIGECVKLHGVKGELVVRLIRGIYVEDIDAEFMHFELDGGLVPFKIKSIRPKNDTDILVSFYDAERESTISRMISSYVYVENDDLNTKTDFSEELNSLTGWLAKDTKAGELGRITDVIEITNNPLFVIDHDGEELLVPANDDLVEDIDEENSVLTLNLPEGLI